MDVKFRSSFYCWCWLLFFLSLMTIGSVSCDNDGGFNKTKQERRMGINKNAAPDQMVNTGKTKKSTFPEMIEQNFLKRKKRQASADPTSDPLVEACKNAKLQSTNPLKCYRCQSSTKTDKEPMCDHRLWKYLKHSEKTRLRETCDPEGKFCAKIVKQKLGERITNRSCFSESFYYGSKQILSRSGCLTFNDDNYRSTLCLCDTDFCNTSTRATQFVGLILVSIALYISIYIYYNFKIVQDSTDYF